MVIEMYGLIAQVCALFIIITLNVVYFKKQKIKTTETDLYSVLLLTTLAAVIIDVAGSTYSLLGYNYDIVVYFNKLYFFIICIFGVLMFYYAYYLASGMSVKEKNYLTKFTFIICIFISIYYIVLPLDVHVDGHLISTAGGAKLFTNMFLGFWAVIIVFLILFRLIRKPKSFKKEKVIPVLIFVLLLIIIGIIQYILPTLSIVTFAFAFTVLLMFFTIENPDIKLIEELNIAKNQALKASNAKTDFLSNMSHEIRTPLNAIVGFSQLIQDSEDTEKIKEEAHDILIASNMLLDIINGILDLSKIEANKLEIINKEYEFKDLYEGVTKLAKTKIGDKEIEFINNLDSNIPPVLYGDEVRVKQIILNLLTNAIKYTDKGFVKLDISSVIKNNKCTLTICIEDSGQGIKKEELDKLFKKFQRLNEDENISIEGTGLGLVITKKLVELMNGKIVVESDYNKGSKFCAIIEQEIVDKKRLEDTVEIKKTIYLPNKKILIVDDNMINLKVAKKLMESYGCSIKTVSSGYECLEEVNNGYDIVFLDDMMPGMTGTETLEKLKLNSSFKTPVIALTANALAEMRDKYLSSGFDDYLAKPINRAELDKIIVKFLKD